MIEERTLNVGGDHSRPIIRRLANAIHPGAFGGVAACLLVLIVLAVVVGPWLWTPDPDETDLMARFLSPGRAHPLGTDEYGRDMLSRLLHGGRLTLFGGAIVLTGCMVTGISIGAIGGFAGGMVDVVISRLLDGLLALPTLVVALGIVSVLGASYTNLMIILVLTGWPWVASVMRGLVRNQRQATYVLAARTLGASPARLLLRHILPNVLGPTLVIVCTSFGTTLLSLTSLTFLGLGVQQPVAEWGAMVSESRIYVQSNPWVIVVPGGAIGGTVLTINFLGDALRDRFDPRHHRH